MFHVDNRIVNEGDHDGKPSLVISEKQSNSNINYVPPLAI